MSDTAEFLEREIETHRANVEETLDKLKDRLSVDQLMDDIGQFIGVDDVPGTLASAGRQVRDNPLAVGVIGIGLAWLVLGRSHGETAEAERSARRYRPQDASWPATPSAPSEMYGNRARDVAAHEVARGAGAVAEQVEAVTAKVSDVAQGARAAAADLGARVRSGVGGARGAVSPLAQRLGRYPLLLGAAALVAGAVIGSAMPRSRTEDRLLGGTRSRLRDEAVVAARGLKDRAVNAVSETYEAAVDAAEKEGLLPDPMETLETKLEAVADAALGEARAQVKPVLDGAHQVAEAARKAVKARG